MATQGPRSGVVMRSSSLSWNQIGTRATVSGGYLKVLSLAGVQSGLISVTVTKNTWRDAGRVGEWRWDCDRCALSGVARRDPPAASGPALGLGLELPPTVLL